MNKGIEGENAEVLTHRLIEILVQDEEFLQFRKA
jgi:hypothetical protein